MKTLFKNLAEDRFFVLLLAGLVVLSALTPTPFASFPALVDWPTIAALTGLLLLTKGLEASGSLQQLGHWLMGFVATERAAAFGLVTAAALLSTVLTNDVALFVVVPLTLSACRQTTVPTTRLIVFEALAVNAGSALTPIGNPQNLFLWQLSKVSFAEFVWQMLPLVTLLMAALWLMTAFAFPAKPVRPDANPSTAPLDRAMFITSLGLYLPFLIATDLHYAGWALVAVMAVFLVLRPRLLVQLDWGLILVFVLMFIDLRLFAGLDWVSRLITSLGLSQPLNLYLAAIGASQVISNVPAAIALAEYSKDWRVLAYGVNVGSFGFMLGSLANLIALRLSGDRRAWLSFHAFALPALLVAACLGYVLLF